MKKKIPKILGVLLTLVLLVSLTLVLAPAAPAGASPATQVWERVYEPRGGVAGGYVLGTGLTTLGPIDQAVDGTLYVAQTGATTVSYLMKSTDEGRTWSTAGRFTVAPIVDLVCSPEESNVLYWATTANVYKSADGGATYTTVTPAPAGKTIKSIDVVKLAGRYMLLVGADGGATNDAGDVYILDEGAAFPSLTSMGFRVAVSTTIDVVLDVAFMPDFATSRGVVAAGFDDGADNVYISTKLAGGSWGGSIGNPAAINADATAVDMGFPSDFSSSVASGKCAWFVSMNDVTGANEGIYYIQGLTAPTASLSTRVRTAEFQSIQVTGPATSALILAGEVGTPTVHHSATGGGTWTVVGKQPSGAGPTYVLMASDFITSGKAWAACAGNEGGISYTEDTCVTWNQRSLINTSIAKINDLAFYNNELKFLVTDDGTDDSVWRYDGTYWERVLSSTVVGLGAVDQVEVASDGTVFATNIGGTTIYYSANDGQRWLTQTTAVPAAIQGWVVIDSSTLITGGTVNVYITTNNGLSWTTRAVTGAGNIKNFALAPDYATSGDILAGDDTGEVYLSTDNGTSWTQVGTTVGAAIAYVAFDINYATNKTMYCTAGDPSVAGAAVGGVYRFVYGTSTAWARIDSVTGGFESGADVSNGCGIVVSPDGTLYVADADNTKDLSMSRCLAPTAATAPTVLIYFEKVNDTATGTMGAATQMEGLWLTSGSDANVLWTFDDTANAIYRYTDELAKAITGVTATAKTTGAKLAWDAPTAGTLTYAAICDDDARCTSDAVGVTHVIDDLDREDDITGLTSGVTYYFKVRVATPVRSRWSDILEFTTTLPAITQTADLTGPAPGATDVTTTPVFQWAPIAGATAYDIELADEPEFIGGGSVIASAYGITTNVWACPVTLDYSTTYYWRVRVAEPVQGTWSVGIFTTIAEPAPPVEVKEVTPQITVEVPPPTEVTIPQAPAPITPAWIYAIVVIGAVLVIVVIVLIVRTRRVP